MIGCKNEDNPRKLKKTTQRKLLEYFVLEVTARSAADILGIQPNTAILFYRKIRLVISHHLALEADQVFEESIEFDESYFGGKHKGKRGRGAIGKVAVFGILKRGGKVYTVVVENPKRESLLHVIKKKIMPEAWFIFESFAKVSDCLSSYDVLDVSGFTHHRINHSKLFADRQNHINGIENFWNQAKRVLRKYNGIDRKSFPLFLKECEFRFNFGTPKQQLKTLRLWCSI